MDCEQLKSEGRKELPAESPETHEIDADVDSESRMKLEQLVKNLQTDIVVRWWCFFVLFLPFMHLYFLQYFDAVDWVTERTSSLYKMLY